MSQNRVEELKDRSRAALTRSLGHVRATALVAALVPLAGVALTPAVAQAQGSGGDGGYSVPSPCDFVTSGGFVTKDVSGAKVTFGAHGGCKNGAFKGSITVSDHELDYHVDMVQMTLYLAFYPDLSGPASVARDICGTARSSDASEGLIAFRIRLEDNDEPGITDQFGIRLAKVDPSTNLLAEYYHVSTRLLGDGGPGGGNVQLHKPNKTNVGPAAPGTEATMCFGLATP